MSRYEVFILSLELGNFVPDEWRQAGEPPEYLWHNGALTAVVLDELRREHNRGIMITPRGASYRDPVVNRERGGRPRSQHPANTAVDFKVSGLDPRSAAEPLIRWRKEGRLFRVPIRVERVQYVTPGGLLVPFAEIERWDLHGGEACLMRLAGGVGIYDTFVHFDTRGVNATWRG